MFIGQVTEVVDGDKKLDFFPYVMRL